MEIEKLTVTSGYVGSLGKQYHTPNVEELETILIEAARFNGVSKEKIVEMISAGQVVKWRESPNYYYDHSHGTIALKKSEPVVKMVKCDCGHTVPVGSRMSASMGSSCPDCYDRMSD